MGKSRIILLIAILLISCSIFGSVQAQEEKELQKSFFVNIEDGTPRCMIVVGEKAANEDVVSAAFISGKMGSMCYYDILVGDEERRIIVPIDSFMYLKTDFLITEAQLNNNNIILVGGPIANSLVMDLVENGLTTVAFWESSYGDVINYGNVFSEEYEVIVVAGSDRVMTYNAALNFVNNLYYVYYQ